MESLVVIFLLIALVVLWYRGESFLLISIVTALLIAVWLSPSIWFWIIYLPVNIVLLMPSIRAKLISKHIVSFLKNNNLLPNISTTEKVALRAGDVWVDGELFSGKPDFEWISKQSYPELTDEERAFLDNETDELCAMNDDAEVFKKRDLSPQVWEFMKSKKFFGMVIPKEYGGLGFSALGHSAVVQKLASRSQVLAITAMVPNSIGPAELILEHGTQEQKDHYLPRLADGRDLPCFALTEPLAGSDATSIHSTGVLFKDKKDQIKIRLNFEKRYITLGSVATVLGLAFVLKDPEQILGKEDDLGITFALVPSTAKGLVQGRRHDPLGVPFINSPLSGTDVVINIDDIIGGRDGVGEGWKMLMESLSVGRGISLPSTGCGGIKLTARVTGAYAMVREQFGIPIARFEGIRYELANIAAFTYMMDAARIYTIGAIDDGKKPAVINAVMKYHATEKFRDVINSGMDILGGAGIILGKKNLLGHAYMGAPIAITVEGANIMTRTLIQFGQGVIRCHPYAYEEIEALERGDVEAFDKYFFKHVGFTLTNGLRAAILSVTRGVVHMPHYDGELARYEQKLVSSSASFAFFTDVVMALYGGGFKQREMLSARFADILSWMYLLSATMRRYDAEGRRQEDRVYLEWVAKYSLNQIQLSYEQIFANLGSGVIGWIFKYPVRWYARLNSLSTPPSDKDHIRVSQTLLRADELRERLTDGIFIPQDSSQSLYNIEKAFAQVEQTLPIKRKIKKAIRAKTLPKAPLTTLFDKALEEGVITQDELELLKSTQILSDEVVQVDSYESQKYVDRVLD